MMFYYSTKSQFERRSYEFICRIYMMRMIGDFLCIPLILSALEELGALSVFVWIGICLNGLMWPHLAWLLSKNAEKRIYQEYINLIIDSTLSGVWIAAIGINPIPTAILLTMVTADKLLVGGWKLLFPSSAGLCISFALTWWSLGFPFNPIMTLRTFGATVPFLFMYSVCISYLGHIVSKRNTSQIRSLDRISRTDPNVELPNRRHFEDVLGYELDQFRKNHLPSSILFLDIDNFKKINDLYGHLQGDVLLKSVATVLQENCRAKDIPSRFGGDEFAVILPGANLAMAYVMAERIRLNILSLRLKDLNWMPITVSVGIAEIDEEFDSVKAWIEVADQALYAAKADGRNRVMPRPGGSDPCNDRVIT